MPLNSWRKAAVFKSSFAKSWRIMNRESNMKLFKLAYKDIFLMSLSFGLSPFGRHHLSAATRHLSFFKQGQNSKVQRLSLLGFPIWRAASFLGDGCWEWWLPFGETTLTQRVCPYTYRLHSNPNIHIKDTHICHHEGYSLIRDMPISLGKTSSFLLLSRIYHRTLCIRGMGNQVKSLGLSLSMTWVDSLSLFCSSSVSFF